MAKFKSGDKVVVVDLPENACCLSPRGEYDLKNGDIITLTGEEFLFAERFFVSYKTNKTSFNPSICIEYIKLLDEKPPIECTCDIWITGCICGVFEQEKKRK